MKRILTALTLTAAAAIAKTLLLPIAAPKRYPALDLFAASVDTLRDALVDALHTRLRRFYRR